MKAALKTANAQETALQKRLGLQQGEIEDKAHKLEELSLKQVHILPHSSMSRTSSQRPVKLHASWVLTSRSEGIYLRLQGATREKMQQDASAFQQQLESINAQLKHKETELQRTVDSLSRLQTNTKAHIDQLSTELQGARATIQVLHDEAKTAADVHQVRKACLHACVSS